MKPASLHPSDQVTSDHTIAVLEYAAAIIDSQRAGDSAPVWALSEALRTRGMPTAGQGENLVLTMSGLTFRTPKPPGHDVRLLEFVAQEIVRSADPEEFRTYLQRVKAVEASE